MIATNTELQKNAEKIAHMDRILEKYGTIKAPPTGLVYGVPERWLKRPHELNQADQQRLIEAIA